MFSADYNNAIENLQGSPKSYPLLRWWILYYPLLKSSVCMHFVCIDFWEKMLSSLPVLSCFSFNKSSSRTTATTVQMDNKTDHTRMSHTRISNRFLKISADFSLLPTVCSLLNHLICYFTSFHIHILQSGFSFDYCHLNTLDLQCIEIRDQ